MKNLKFERKETKKQQSSGITLIALVITIIVLLILAGISIAMLSGDNSILSRATDAKERTERAEIIEKTKMEILAKQVENRDNSITKEQLKDALDKYFKDIDDIELKNSIDFSNETELTTIDEKYKVKLIELYIGDLSYEIVEGTTDLWELNESKDTIIRFKGTKNDIEGDTFIIPNYVEGNKIISIGMSGPIVENETVLGKKIKISEGIEIITNAAFARLSGLIGNLTIPCSVKIVNSSAFSGCSGLDGTLTVAAKEISGMPFWGTNFKTLILQDGVETIKGSAFSNVSSFTGDLTIPSSVKTINGGAFGGCNGFNGTLKVAAKEITDGSFCGTNFKTLILQDGVETIKGSAFSNVSSFTGDLTIPSSVKKIDGNAFNGCSGFNGTLKIAAKEIGDAFTMTNFKTLVIDNGVESIGSSALKDLISLTGEVTIPNSVKKIDSLAFAGCSNLSSIKIKNSKSNIDVAEDAFDGAVAPTYEI